MNVEAFCVGHAAYDLTMVVDEYPSENAKLETKDLIESGGGPAANAAYLLAKWQVPTAFAGLIGDDSYGARIVEEFRDVKADLSLAEIRRGHSTPVSFVVVNRATGSRTIINRKASAGPLEVDLSSVGWEPKVMLFDGHEPEASQQALRAFPNAITVLDAGSVRPGIVDLAGRVDYLVCSERFARQLSGLESLAEEDAQQQVLRRIREIAPKTIVVTLGERGLIYDSGGRHGRLNAMSVRAVDTTGAGDIFHGAFVFGLLRDMHLAAVLLLATTAAGLSAQSFGGRASIPELSAVQAAMKHG